MSERGNIEELESDLVALQRRVEDLEQRSRDINWSLQDRIIQASLDAKWVLALLLLGWLWQWLA